MTVPVGKVIEAYLNTRRELERREEEFKASIAPLKEFQSKREAFIAKVLEEQGVNSVKEKGVGTAFFTRAESVTVRKENWQATLKWIIENDKLELLPHSVAKTEVLELMGEDRTNPLPEELREGIKYSSFRKVCIQKR